MDPVSEEDGNHVTPLPALLNGDITVAESQNWIGGEAEVKIKEEITIDDNEIILDDAAAALNLTQELGIAEPVAPTAACDLESIFVESPSSLPLHPCIPERTYSRLVLKSTPLCIHTRLGHEVSFNCWNQERATICEDKKETPLFLHRHAPVGTYSRLSPASTIDVSSEDDSSMNQEWATICENEKEVPLFLRRHAPVGTYSRLSPASTIDVSSEDDSSMKQESATICESGKEAPLFLHQHAPLETYSHSSPASTIDLGSEEDSSMEWLM